MANIENVVGGDLLGNYDSPGQSREVCGHELVYDQKGSGLEGSFQVLVGNKWLVMETATGDISAKWIGFANDRRFRYVATGTGTSVFTLSPSTPIPG